MTDNKVLDLRTVWASFMDDNNKQVQGFFKLLEQTVNYVKLISGKNIITIPYHRLLKMKEVMKDD